MPTLLGLQYLRALAALAVVVFHVANGMNDALGTDLPRLRIGAFGVDLFFVISGFIMWTISEARPLAPWPFFRRRLERIVPLYWALTLVAALVDTTGGLSLGLDAEPGFLLASLFFVPVFNDRYPEMVAPLLNVGWTLNLEMVFYLLFALALPLPRLARLWGLAGLLAVASALDPLVPPTGLPAVELYVDGIVAEFGLGMLLAALWQRPRLRDLAEARGLWLAAPLLAGAVAWLGLGLFEPYRGLRWGLPALAIVAAALLAEPWLRARPWRPGLVLGDASYAIYLSHLMALPVAHRLVAPLTLPVSPWLTLACETAFAAVVGVAIWALLERPSTHLLRRLT